MKPRALALPIVLLVFGCGPGWKQPRVAPEGRLKPRQQVQVWQGGEVRQWHAVIVTRDSIGGISYLQRTDCDSCRVAVPRATVDSVRLGDPVSGVWKSAGLVVLGMFALVIAVYGGWPQADN